MLNPSMCSLEVPLQDLSDRNGEQGLPGLSFRVLVRVRPFGWRATTVLCRCGERRSSPWTGTRQRVLEETFPRSGMTKWGRRAKLERGWRPVTSLRTASDCGDPRREWGKSPGLHMAMRPG